eukprot:6078250-Pyramimonas_sp.AAC.1
MRILGVVLGGLNVVWILMSSLFDHDTGEGQVPPYRLIDLAVAVLLVILRLGDCQFLLRPLHAVLPPLLDAFPIP